MLGDLFVDAGKKCADERVLHTKWFVAYKTKINGYVVVAVYDR